MNHIVTNNQLQSLTYGNQTRAYWFKQMFFVTKNIILQISYYIIDESYLHSHESCRMMCNLNWPWMTSLTHDDVMVRIRLILEYWDIFECQFSESSSKNFNFRLKFWKIPLRKLIFRDKISKFVAKF